MRRIEVDDEWLRRHMPAVDEAMIRELEDGTDYTYQFSARFERKMKRLLRREARPRTGVWSGGLRRAAVLALCTVAALALLSMSAEGRRLKFFDTVRTMWEDAVQYTYVTDGREREFQARRPGYVPAGYEEAERRERDTFLCLTYRNRMGDEVRWQYQQVVDSDAVIMDTGYDAQVTAVVDGKMVTICTYAEGWLYAYCEYGGAVCILVADRLTLEEVYQMFKGKW